MRILFIGGMYRGFRLAQRLIERGEDVVGAFVYEEDAHESPKFCDRLVSLFAASSVWVQQTRKITRDQLSDVRDRLAPDVIFCLGWRTLVPMEILNCAPRGGIAVHDSLLPRLRGFAPTNWGLVLGHDRLGATLFQLTDSVDAGDVYFQEAIEVDAADSYGSVHQKIGELTVKLFDRYLDATRTGMLAAHQQTDAEATYACARLPSDGEIDWQRSSKEVDRLVRALGPPAPWAFTYLRGAPLCIIEASHVELPRSYEGRIPGRIANRDCESGTVDVLCGEGVLRISTVRTTDGAVRSAASVMRSVRESLGLDHSLEIVNLRTRLDRLESHLAQLRAESVVEQPR